MDLSHISDEGMGPGPHSSEVARPRRYGVTLQSNTPGLTELLAAGMICMGRLEKVALYPRRNRSVSRYRNF